MGAVEGKFRLWSRLICSRIFTFTQLEMSIAFPVQSDSLAAIESAADLTASRYGDLIRLPSPERTAAMKV